MDNAFVTARESAFTYRGKSVDVREVGRQLGVRYVLEGSVRKLGDAVRTNAQLVSAGDGAHVWAERFDQPLRDLEAGQDSTVQRIGSALNVKFDSAKQQPKTGTSNPTTYDLVLRAKAVLHEPQTESRDAIAAGYFEQALRLDLGSVAAKAGVATMLVKTSRFTDRAAHMIQTAAYAAPRSPDVLAAKFRLLRRQLHYEEPTATFRKLLEIDSSAAGIAAEFDYCPVCWGRPEGAFDLIMRTARLNHSLLTILCSRSPWGACSFCSVVIPRRAIGWNKPVMSFRSACNRSLKDLLTSTSVRNYYSQQPTGSLVNLTMPMACVRRPYLRSAHWIGLSETS